jgi:hypothetical protein
MRYQESTLPVCEALATMPLVLRDGTLLATNRLDRKRKILVRIDPALVALLPTSVCDDDVKDAIEFLTDEWLCDVSASFESKCVLIAYALSTLERLLFSTDRPAFWVTAGLRGGGKTTALRMIMLAITGKPPAAAAWSDNPEERRKAIFAALRENVPSLIFDNIPRGSMLSCPTVEKVCTSADLTDRVLQESRK